ncbi:DUF2510 domain-containing protein [Paenarthrobacter sp. CC6]
MTAPGCYPDPADPRCLRWWNGTGWTDRVRPPAFQPTPIAWQGPGR